jgi:hypothetical protein
MMSGAWARAAGKRSWVLLVTSFITLPLVTGCPKKPDKIVAAGEDKGLTDAEIDSEPIALLPSGAVGLFSVDTKKLFASPFGQKLLAIARVRTPVPASAKFDPGVDLEHAFVGVYSMQGADAAAVLTGRFDKAAIELAADGTQRTPLGTPVVKSTYAGRTLYTSHNLGFVVLTPRTVLLGNETGIRRALDRIKEGRVRKQIPPWFEELLKTPNAPVVAGFDLRAQPVTDAARQQFPFLNGMETARMVGNFESPGVNLAGTLSYGDAAGAQAGAQSLMSIKDMAASFGWLASLLGIGQPIRQLDAKAEDKDTKFVAALDAGEVGKMLDQLSTYLGVPNQPNVIPATQSPGVGAEPGVPKK